MNFSFDKRVVDNIFNKFENISMFSWSSKMSFQEVYKILNVEETDLLNQLLLQKPGDYNLSDMPFYGLEESAVDLVELTGQKLKIYDEVIELNPVYIPKNVLKQFKLLSEQYYNDTKRKLFVFYAYRSPAFQALLFIHRIKFYNYDLAKTVSLVAFPGYSQHGLLDHTALDFVNQDGVGIKNLNLTKESVSIHFEHTEEYRWLLANAEKYGFYLSFPQDNKTGITFEPWHWQYRGD